MLLHVLSIRHSIQHGARKTQEDKSSGAQVPFLKPLGSPIEREVQVPLTYGAALREYMERWTCTQHPSPTGHAPEQQDAAGFLTFALVIGGRLGPETHCLCPVSQDLSGHMTLAWEKIKILKLKDIFY